MFWIARGYSWIYGIVKDGLGINLPGLGVLLRRIRRDRTLKVHGRFMWLDHTVAQSYGRLVSGAWNEPETHKFLHRIFREVAGDFTFIDVGANVGEMVIDLAGVPDVKLIYAFEPISECASAIRTSLALNGYENVEVFNSLCGNHVGSFTFTRSIHISDSSLHLNPSGLDGDVVPMTTLDLSIKEVRGTVIMLVDVEGFELEVMRGGSRLIAQYEPLIVFEYNHVSKMHFSVDQVSDLLGEHYSIFRLRRDGWVDVEVASAWNCVAIPKRLSSSISLAC